MLQCVAGALELLPPQVDAVAVCCSVLQCVAVCCSVLQCVAVYCSVLQCVAAGRVHCSVTALLPAAAGNNSQKSALHWFYIDDRVAR